MILCFDNDRTLGVSLGHCVDQVRGQRIKGHATRLEFPSSHFPTPEEGAEGVSRKPLFPFI
jgi:hypothetical protein